MSAASQTSGRPQRWSLPTEEGLGLKLIRAGGGLSAGVLPNGALFALEHEGPAGRIMINQILGSPIDGPIGRILLRVGDQGAPPVEIVGPRATVAVGASERAIAWQGEASGVSHRVVLELDDKAPIWRWQVELTNRTQGEVRLDVVLLQDLGLGDRGFLMNNEAYASQYLDHTIETHPRFGPVILNRQNLDQGGRHPWVAHACLDGTSAWATDAVQVFGTGYREADVVPLAAGVSLPSERLQREVACASLQSAPRTLPPGGSTTITFVGLFAPDHPGASGAADLGLLDQAIAAAAWGAAIPATAPAARSVVQGASPLRVRPLSAAEVAASYPERVAPESVDGELLSFFVPHGSLNRHVVLRGKEDLVERRHGLILRSGRGVLPTDDILCTTCWMHGVFAAQLTLGNTSFHKLFSVSRDPFNITRSSGLRIYVEHAGGWRLLATPSAFEMGLNDCRWIYESEAGRIVVAVQASVEGPGLRFSIESAEANRFLLVGALVMGERDLGQTADVVFDVRRGRISFKPDMGTLWGQHYPGSIYVLAADAPASVEAMGATDLLFGHGHAFETPHVALRTLPVKAFGFAITGDLSDAAAADAAADRFSSGFDPAAEQAAADGHWSRFIRGPRIDDDGGAGFGLVLPWLVQDAIVHVSVPHGLEQYTGAAWGTRDVCQGPIEMLLALGHDADARAIMMAVFAEQYEGRGDWSQWFMLPPYSFIRDRSSHGDVIVWPLKMVCDYIETTGDIACLDEPLPWRRYDDATATSTTDTLAGHIEVLLATVADRFLPGTHLIRLGEGDWNDSLQPADPSLKEHMVSSWTVALLFQQLRRYAAIVARRDNARARTLDTLASAMKREFNDLLMRDGIVAGYGVFGADGRPRLLLHPTDTTTSVSYSLLPMVRAIAGGLFTDDQARTHLRLIAEHLTFPDGVRLMDMPLPYHGGLETIFRRAESSAYFGREIGLMYTHAHLQYAQALAALLPANGGDGARGALRAALAMVNPVTVRDIVPNASLRQRNTYFSSSDSAVRDRLQASSDWSRVRDGSIAADGGWRIYSSGPGLFVNLLIGDLLGMRRRDGQAPDAVAG